MFRPRLAITMGDPAGVGPELCVQVLSDPKVLEACHPIVFGDHSVLERVAKLTQTKLTARRFSISEVNQLKQFSGPAICDLNRLDSDDVQPGQVSATTGRAAFDYVQASIEAAVAGRVHGVVTAPIHKEAFHAAGVAFPGHTEMFAELTACRRYCMMLTSDAITCAFVTSHVGLRDVANLVTRNRVVEVIELTDEALREQLGRPPRLTVLGLNPHAGEQGLFGAGEEERVIAPAIQLTAERGLQVIGPLPPDTAFLPGRRRATDAYICMYHDQGLIPLKTLAFDTAVNVTLGLPIIRSSVDHGTALDIAWRGQVDGTSMQCAIQWASDTACRRA